MLKNKGVKVTKGFDGWCKLFFYALDIAHHQFAKWEEEKILPTKTFEADIGVSKTTKENTRMNDANLRNN